MRRLLWMFLIVCSITTTASAQLGDLTFTDTIVSVELLPLTHDIIVGDVNADQELDMDDITYLLDYLFSAGPPPLPEKYSSVRQMYVRTVIIGVSWDSTESEPMILQVLEIGTLRFIPQSDSASVH